MRVSGNALFKIVLVDRGLGYGCVGRYLAYFVSTIPLALGLIWVAFDKRKQEWHDKLAGTVVIRTKKPA